MICNWTFVNTLPTSCKSKTSRHIRHWLWNIVWQFHKHTAHMLKSETINFNSVHTHCQFGTIAALSDLSIYIHQNWSRDMAVGNNSLRTPFSLIYTNSCVCIIRNSGRHNPLEAIFSHLLIDSDLYWRGY